jgi:hypothetical protein
MRVAVSIEGKPTDDDLERENSRLAEGLKSCRAVVSDYRELIAGDAEATAGARQQSAKGKRRGGQQQRADG